MPSTIDKLIKRRVIQQWVNGVPRDQIAVDNNVAAGTVSGIINNYKTQLDNSDFDSIRGLAMEIRKRGLNFADLSSLLRLYNFFRESGANQDEIESFVAKVHSGGMPQDKVVEYMSQLYDISRDQSVALEHVPSYIKEKLEDKQKIDQEIKEASEVLHKKNVTIEAVEEHLKLKEALEQHGVSIQDIDKLLTLLNNAKENGFDTKKIVMMFSSIKRLEKKRLRLKDNCDTLSKQMHDYIDILPLTEDIAALGIGIHELISLKAAMNQAVKCYSLPPLAATLRLIEDIKKYEKIGGLKRELKKLCIQKLMINEACSRQSQALIALAKMQNQEL